MQVGPVRRADEHAGALAVRREEALAEVRVGARRVAAAPVGAPPAVINAIVDALNRRTGARHIDMPATPRRVWEVLKAAH